WAEAVGIVDLNFAAVPETHANGVTARVAVQYRAIESSRMAFQHGISDLVQDDIRRVRLGQEGADLPAGGSALFPDQMWAENAKGIAVISTNNRFNLFSNHESIGTPTGPLVSFLLSSASLLSSTGACPADVSNLLTLLARYDRSSEPNKQVWTIS